jgi:hypothetical protein
VALSAPKPCRSGAESELWPPEGDACYEFQPTTMSIELKHLRYAAVAERCGSFQGI